MTYIPRTQKIVRLPINQIEPDPHNPNIMEPKSYKQLKEDMKAGRYYDPIEVRRIGRDRFRVVDGNHRLGIAKELGWKTINCVVLKVDEVRARLRTLKKHIHRGQRNLVGIAENINLLRGLGLPLNSIASQLHFKKRHVYEILEVLDLEDDVKELVRSGAVTLKHVNVTSPLKNVDKITERLNRRRLPPLLRHMYKHLLETKMLGPSLQNDMLREVARDKLSVRETKKRVKDILRKWRELEPVIEVGNHVYPGFEIPMELFEKMLLRANKEGKDIHEVIENLMSNWAHGKYDCPYCGADLTLGERNCPECQKLGFDVLRRAKRQK